MHIYILLLQYSTHFIVSFDPYYYRFSSRLLKRYNKRKIEIKSKQKRKIIWKYKSRKIHVRVTYITPKLYCICKTPDDGSKYFVQCDSCEEWYHGQCLNISEEDAERPDFKLTCLKCTSGESNAYDGNANAAVVAKKKKVKKADGSTTTEAKAERLASSKSLHEAYYLLY